MPKGQKEQSIIDKFPDQQNPVDVDASRLAPISSLSRRLGYASAAAAHTNLIGRNQDTFPTPRVAVPGPTPQDRDTVLWDTSLVRQWDVERREVFGHGGKGGKRPPMAPDPAYRYGIAGPPSPHPETGAIRPRADAHLLGIRSVPPARREPGLVGGNGTAGGGQPFRDLFRTQRSSRFETEAARQAAIAASRQGAR